MSLSHEALARQNFHSSSSATTPEWRVTMLFYAAVHAANHILYPGGFAPPTATHQERNAMIEQHPKLKGIKLDYRQLLTLSITSRYVPKDHPMSESKVNHARTLAARVLSIAGIPTAPPVASP